MLRTEKQFSGFTLVNIQTEDPKEISGINAEPGQALRVELPANAAYIPMMSEQGFTLGDRTIGVTINLKRASLDYGKLVRFEMQPAGHELDGEILRIAGESFPTDRRFHVRPGLDMDTAREVIRQWVGELNEVYVCYHKDRIVGFIDLEQTGESEKFIHLAAVEERYRAAGAALSMYAYVIKKAKDEGCTKIAGRISSTNTAVMNLYAYLGGSFQEPVDVYLKEGTQ